MSNHLIRKDYCYSICRLQLNANFFHFCPLTRNLDIKMGSEQSQQANAAAANGRVNTQSRLQRGHTIAVSGRRLSSPNDDFAAGQAPPDSRPVSPPISVCSDSDLPYVSYTDKLGGEFFLSLFFVISSFRKSS